jgi:hypothetical protein
MKSRRPDATLARSATKILSVVLLVVFWCAPLAAFVYFFHLPDEMERASLVSEETSTTTVGSRQSTLATSVDTSLRFSPQPVAMLAKSGLVTAVHLRPMDGIDDGTPIVDIDGVPVLAYFGNTPFYRDLDSEASGADVVELNNFLSRLGYDVVVDSPNFRWSTKVAVNELEKRLGVKPTGVFKREYVAYFPPVLRQVASINVEVGAAASAGGMVVGGFAPIAGVGLSAKDSAQSLNALAGSPVTLTLPTGGTVDLSSIQVGQDELPIVSTALIDAGLVTTAMRTAAEDAKVEGLVVQLTTPVDQATVEGTAVLVLPSNEGRCLFVDSGKGHEAIQLEGDIQPSSEIGQTLIPIQYLGLQVVRNPYALPEPELLKCD